MLLIPLQLLCITNAAANTVDKVLLLLLPLLLLPDEQSGECVICLSPLLPRKCRCNP
jgi:hypothetical protein